MTISYSLETATSGAYYFYRFIVRWKGSVWQGIWQGLVAWCVAYGVLSIIYRNFLDEPNKQFFEKLSLFCAKYAEYIPLTFMLGFYVSFVINRWWDQFMNLGWIDTPCMLLSTYVRGGDDGAQLAITTYRSSLGLLFSYDWISIPLAYSQVVNLGVRTYFIAGILGRQYLRQEADPTNIFVIFVGWLKVAEVLMNPLGEDAEDFELNYIITRNIQIGLCMVDESYGLLPKLEKDAFWDSDVVELPHTEASKANADYEFMGSCVDMRVKEEDQAFVTPLVDQQSQRSSMCKRPMGMTVGSRRCLSTAVGSQEIGIRRDCSMGCLELPYTNRSQSVAASPVLGIKRRFSFLNGTLRKQVEQKRPNHDMDLSRKRSAVSSAYNDDSPSPLPLVSRHLVTPPTPISFNVISPSLHAGETLIPGSDVASDMLNFGHTEKSPPESKPNATSYEYSNPLPVILENVVED